MNWWRENWQLKLVAFALALFLWIVLYLNPPETDIHSVSWPPHVVETGP
ncbi:MAG TPA: hypothetical protein P5079_06245 [Elusimicrobiota bacterium]|nr:hypothetical protein [Elusimicrobiota bacterium]